MNFLGLDAGTLSLIKEEESYIKKFEVASMLEGLCRLFIPPFMTKPSREVLT